MAPRKGFTHSDEARARMSASRKGQPHSEERKAKISAALKGRVFEKKYRRVCLCGVEFLAAQSHAKWHSTKCKKASIGHGIVHGLAFAHFAKQCAICGALEQLVGDHDHKTGLPRGVLCRRCNLAIGNMDDQPARLRAAAAYLERS